jgi:hypothetical protein
MLPHNTAASKGLNHKELDRWYSTISLWRNATRCSTHLVGEDNHLRCPELRVYKAQNVPSAVTGNSLN